MIIVLLENLFHFICKHFVILNLIYFTSKYVVCCFLKYFPINILTKLFSLKFFFCMFLLMVKQIHGLIDLIWIKQNLIGFKLSMYLGTRYCKFSPCININFYSILYIKCSNVAKLLILWVFFIFPDENFAVPHLRRGMVGFANKGRHTNGSQFYVTLQPTKWMDTKYVAFG